jgi:pimeloyl-ACP methyl ester carboxylesterase
MAIVLVPGFMLDSDMWSDVVPYFDFAAPLIHAETSNGSTIEEMARQILQTAPAHFVLIGFSMGGYIAREIARIAPERVSHLILVATSSRGDTEQQILQKQEAVSAMSASFAGVSRKSIRQSLAPQHEHDSVLIGRIRAMSLRLGREVFRKQALMPRKGDDDGLAEIQCPTLVIAGAFDQLRSMEEAEELQRGIPGAILAVMDAGHMIPMESPDEMARAVLDFLSETVIQQ